ncbi:MAG: lysine--tRNA ligase [Candidatus Bathyarchaeota archaeon]|nr:lysine--tRNA ligase [Candidatus Bathyarchaeota archaeon]
MTDTIIGHGTWFDKTALRIVERERKLGRSLDLIRTEMGIGISGIPHVGHVGDAARSYGVSVALMAQGYGSELVAFADDKDGLRKVPAGLPKSLEKYLGFPVREIPDPYKCHGNFAEHIKLLLVDALDRCGVQYRIVSGAEMYEKGLLANEIKAILENAKKVGAIIQEEVGQEKYEAALPYFAVCSQCGRIYTTRSYEFLPNEGKVLYACEGMEVKGQWFDGCGHKGEADYRKGEGKLVWKVEFAARWKALDIRFEAYGKDIADSVRVNDRICREILKWDPPTHVQYEMFLDKSGKKISKSAGNVFTPQVWFRYGSPQSLVLLMLKRFVGTRSLSVVDIPQYMSELDELEDIFFGKKRVTDTKERAKLTGLYKYCWWLKPPDNPRIHVPYNLLVYLVRVAPTDSELDYVTQKLLEYGYLEEEKLSPDLDQRIRYARNWARDFEEIKETEMTLSDQERSATKTLIAALQSEADETQIQTAIFNIAREHNVKPRRFFKTLYTMLLGVTEGPRLGPYIVAMGRANVIDALDRALKRHRSK